MPSRIENSLLKRGTFDGPVTPEMIALAKQMYERVCLKLKHETVKDGWEDWIPEARRLLAEKNSAS